MPPALWPLQHGRPVIEIMLALWGRGQGLVRRLVADTGAGTRHSVFQLILTEKDCVDSGGIRMGQVQLGGAYAGSFPLYLVQARIVALNFDEPVPVVGVSQILQGFDGIAGFRFLHRFHYGNFGTPDHFGLDLLPTS